MVILRTIDHDVPPDKNIYSDTTLADVLPDTELFKYNLVVRVIISLIGVFVFFFAIFVLTYIYFKCFRKTSNASGGVRETEWQAQYKSLSFDAVEITEEKTGSLKLDADTENENQKDINIVQSTSIGRKSAYTNVNNEEFWWIWRYVIDVHVHVYLIIYNIAVSICAQDIELLNMYAISQFYFVDIEVDLMFDFI